MTTRIDAPDTEGREMTVRTLFPFFGIAFGLAWSIGALFVIFSEQLEPIFGEMGYTNPLFILIVYSPGLAGVFLVWRHYGVQGLARYFRRLTFWRMPGAWWALLLLGLPAIYCVGAVLSGTISDPFPFNPWYGLLPALGIALMIGPMEEFGWRGVALPLLQRRFAPLWSSLILGAVWGVWHLPAFFAEGTPQGSWSIAPFMIGVVALSVILTPMFNAAQGSLLIPILFHWQLNNPAWPDAQPWDTAVFVLAAVVVVILNRKTMFSREGAVTEVLAPEPAP
jgi:uncharacterized protein